VLKRIILTGYPTRVHKRHATVKYMFYNPEDVKVSCAWFYPLKSSQFGLTRYMHLFDVKVVSTCWFVNQTWTSGKHHPKRW
jgi:hypothetical protein